MPWVTRYLRVGMTLILSVLILISPALVFAATVPISTVASSPKVIITEVQMTGASASKEFIELYNTTDAEIDFADTLNTGQDVWKLHFFSASNVVTGAPTWTQPVSTLSLAGKIEAHGYYLLASTGYTPNDITVEQSYSDRLTSSGGGLQLVDVTPSTTTVHDRVMWSSASTTPLGVWPSPANNGSMQRLPNDDDEYIGEDGKLTDFANEELITPKDIWVAPVPVAEVTEDDDSNSAAIDSTEGGDTQGDQVLVDNTGLVPPIITELLPNPASPALDSTDEYIEVYNPNDEPYQLTGSTLEVGTSTLHDFKISGDLVIPANSYMVFYSESTRLSLTNSGGQARLLDSTGQIISETQAYSAAIEGETWSLSGGVWQWTTTPTPGEPNTITSAPEKISTTAAKAAAAKTAATKVKGTNTTKSKAAPKVKTAKAKTTKTKKPAKTKIAFASNVSETQPRAQVHTGVLVVVAGLALLYGAYEYRHDFANRIHQLRGHRTNRGRARR